MGVLGWFIAAVAIVAAWRLVRERSLRVELVARACHELRGPLAAARLGLHGLQGAGGAVAGCAAAIDLELRRAALALDDLRLAPNGGRVPDRPEPVDLADFLEETVAVWEPVARALGHDLRCEAPVQAWVRGDRVRLAQATGNLIANALEHGAGPIELRGRVDGDRVRIEVGDAGPGLPAPVTELSRRGRSGRGERGRGLAIAAEIAARHGGRLAAAPSGRGARLALDLPAERG